MFEAKQFRNGKKKYYLLVFPTYVTNHFLLKTAKFWKKKLFYCLELQNVQSWKHCCSSTLLVLRTTSIFQRPLEKTNIIGRRPAKSNLNILWHPLRAISASRYGLKKRLTFFKCWPSTFLAKLWLCFFFFKLAMAALLKCEKLETFCKHQVPKS